jgi:hypothetical protein
MDTQAAQENTMDFPGGYDEVNARRAEAAQHEAQALVDTLAHFANGMSYEKSEALADALANEHPTLLGQIAKVVAIGVMRRATRDPLWKPYAYKVDGLRICEQVKRRDVQTMFDLFRDPAHVEHDGRLDCDTIVGAEIMARQSFV